MATTSPKRRNASNLTTRNLTKTRRDIERLQTRVSELRQTVRDQARTIRRLHEWLVLAKSPAFRHVVARVARLEQAGQ